ncbi:MAG: adenylate kinase [Dehalococcoidia bacterium]|nr:adenylate kinase [Dehalococcoidia bacterium]
MNLVLLGPPGSGKGTQAEHLVQKVGLAHLASGDLLRSAVAAGTELGRKTESYMKQGVLVPDEVVIGLILEALEGKSGVILDGFPRTLEQAQALEQALGQRSQTIDRVLYISVAKDELIKRLSSRWTCKQCQAPYNLQGAPPRQEGKCDRCGGELYQRADDQPHTIRKRIEVYLTQTVPLIDYYRRSNRLTEVDGVGEVAQITRAVLQAVGVEG